MVRKRADVKTPAAGGLRLVRLHLPAAEHKEFRKLAAEGETYMALLARKIVREWIAHQREGGSA
jgi:hypothetical protein